VNNRVLVSGESLGVIKDQPTVEGQEFIRGLGILPIHLILFGLPLLQKKFLWLTQFVIGLVSRLGVPTHVSMYKIK
jgi:hypothetical protein